MNPEIWKHPDKDEVIKTHEFHCQRCGSTYRIVLPPDVTNYRAEMEHFARMAKHYREECHRLKRLLDEVLNR